MNNNDKSQIQATLLEYIRQFDSQAKAVATLKGVSEATVINIKNGKWDSISNEMWRTLGRQIGWKADQRLVETLAFETCILYFSLAREEGATFALAGAAGFGKSFSAKWYSGQMRGRNVYYLECASYWNKKYFLIELLSAMGLNSAGLNVYEMMKLVVSELRKQDHPLIILDEVDKLPDLVLQFFITLYNELNGLCGIVWLSTDNIEKRLLKGLRIGKSGYNEIFRRIGRRFIQLPQTNLDEVRNICEANGITDSEEVMTIFNEYEGDISRIDRVRLRNIAKERTKKRA